MTTDKTLTVTLKRSVIGQKQVMKDTVRALGIRRMHQTVSKPDTPTVRGMIRRVIHLVDVQES